MKKIAFVPILLISALVCVNGYAQQLLYQNFDSFTNGSLSGQGAWVIENPTANPSSIQINVNNTSPITGCFGGGGRYITPQTVATHTTERIYCPTTSLPASADQTLYLSFLMNLSSAGTEDNAHIISLGNDFGGTKYEFSRIHTRVNGSGFNIGISKGSGVHFGTNSAGINWSTAVYNLNETYFVVLRYDYDYGGGANADVIRVWVNPSINNGSEPITSSAVATIAPGELGNDILFDGDNIRNVYINNQKNGPVYKIDEIRYAHGATSADAWTNLGISGSCPTTLPVVLSNFTAKADGNYVKLQWQTALEDSNKGFEIWRKVEGGRVGGVGQEGFVKIGEVSANSNGSSNSSGGSQQPYALNPTHYTFTDKNPLNGTNYYKLVQIDNDGAATDLGVREVTFRLKPSALNLYPNPAQSYLHVTAQKPGIVYAYDVLGKLVLKQNVQIGINQLDVRRLKTGSYYLMIDGRSIKFTKQ